MRVTDILDLLAAGGTADGFLRDYPFLESEDLLAVFEYAARQTDPRVLMTP